jgi:exonuclease SbcC
VLKPLPPACSSPDVPALTTAAAGAQTALEAILGRQRDLAASEKRTADWIAALAKDAEKMADLDKQFGVIGHIADVANGNNSQKLTFQRFVLGSLLDDVLLAASQRLKIMSRGRYLLQRQRDTLDLRRAGGLDLEVHDAYTGTARSANTLSGGETFLAALSLALGLADVVQSYAGGIHLDTIFIDEGFGSLDTDALDDAMRALIDLQQAGRLVGIISHVPDLKERIDARLEITAGKTGSSAAFTVA